MAGGAYSFIDIAVLEPVRTRFAAGDALVMLSADLTTVLWANGAGAALFGFSDIEASMGAPAGLGLAARRQISAMSGFPRIGRDKAIIVRLSSGLSSRAAGFFASGMTLPGGEPAILLAMPAEQVDLPDPRATAERAIAGFSGAGYFAALIDAEGEIAAATNGFAGLRIERQALLALVAEVAGERDRVVKRLVAAGKARYPTGFARITDDPALHLLLVVDEDQSAVLSETASPEHSGRVALRQDNRRVAAPPPTPAPIIDASPAGQARGQIDRWYFGVKDETPTVAAGDESPAPVVEEALAAAENEKPAATVAEPVAHSPSTGPATSAREEPAAEGSGPAAPQTASTPTLSPRPSGPVRFVWRTDAEGRFSAISADFAAAVGAEAANVIGRRFREVANAFGFDADGEIAGLLERRDTWSGRSVLWPIAGADLKAPVDLAALPVYARDRTFEGFRGFGVVRVSDAVPDPEAVGLTLVGAEPDAEQEEPAASEAPFAPTLEQPAPSDPFRGEVPALVIDNTPERRFTDKVIRLAEHRHPAVERSLTPVERSAFREIGDRLKKEGAARRSAPEQTPVTTSAEPVETTARVEQEEAEAAIADRALSADASDFQLQIDEDAAASRSEATVGEPSRPDPAGPIQDDGEHAAQVPTGEESDAEAASDDMQPAAGDVVEREIATPSAADPSQEDVTVSAPPLQAEGFLPAAFPEDASTRSREVDVSILSRLPVPVLIHSGDRLHYANPEFLDLTGYESVAALEAAGGLDALFAEPYEAGSAVAPDDRRTRLRTASGEEFPVEALLQSVPWRGGKALLLAIRPMAQPPLEQLSPEAPPAAAELEARLAELRTIVDTATDGVVLITNDGAIRSISRPAEALFGFDSSEVANEPFTSLFAVESQRAARDYLNGLSENGVASVLNDGREVIGREAQGRFIPLFMTIGKLPGDSGYCAVLRDITQWKRAEEELTQARAQAERSSSQKTDFLARVSHEIRTPLNAIIGFSELMIDEKFGPVGNDRYRDYLRDINRSGNHVLDLVNDLLDISKIEAGEQEMSYEAVSLNDALAESVAMLQPQANRERVIIRSSFASRLPEVVADLRSIRQIAINLLSNAIRYTPAGGQVIISTAYESSGDIVMRVRDTGIGMTHAEIEQALKPFKQVNALKRGRGDGTGLGLPLTKAMVEANRARFSINSTPGEGTMVEITFPSTRVLAD